MSYERMIGLGTEAVIPIEGGGSMPRTAEDVRRLYIESIERMSPERARIAREAMALSDEELDARRAVLRQEETRVHSELRAAYGTAQENQLRNQLNQIRAESSVLRGDWSRRRREIETPRIVTQEAERQAEIENMWSTGRWRDRHVFTRWMDGKTRSFGLIGTPVKTWMGSTHCMIVGPQDDRCAGNRAPNRIISAGISILPFATAYYTWKKTNRSIPWTAAGFAGGLAAPTVIGLLWFGGILAIGGAPRY